MGEIEKFEEIEVWKLARIICQNLEKLFNETSLGKNFALKNQMERSSGSIMDNIAEGYGWGGNQGFHNFLSYSKGSASELKSQLYRILDKNLISAEQFKDFINQCNLIENKIGVFMYYLRKSGLKGLKYKKFQE